MNSGLTFEYDPNYFRVVDSRTVKYSEDDFTDEWRLTETGYEFVSYHAGGMPRPRSVAWSELPQRVRDLFTESAHC